SREEWRRTQHAIGTAQVEVDKAQRAVGDLATRRSTLEDAQSRLANDLAEAEAMHEEALSLLEEAGDESEMADAADEAQRRLAAHREKAEQARLKLNTVEAAARMR